MPYIGTRCGESGIMYDTCIHSNTKNRVPMLLIAN